MDVATSVTYVQRRAPDQHQIEFLQVLAERGVVKPRFLFQLRDAPNVIDGGLPLQQLAVSVCDENVARHCIFFGQTLENREFLLLR